MQIGVGTYPTGAKSLPLSKVPKTGLTRRMRAWMSARTGTKAQRRFTIDQICESLGVMAGKQHQSVANALTDFETRKEVESYTSKKHNRRQFLYVLDWRKELKGKINRKIFKAMYVSQNFSVTDIQRHTGLQDRCWIDKVVRKLKEEGHVQQIQRRLCAHGAGAETVYHITNRDKFKLELMR
jgi:ribosomal protein S25